MKRLCTALIGSAILSVAVTSMADPAFALGGCGNNGHRNAYGYCVFGGQNQNWCLRHTGHFATRFRDGTMRCL